MLWFNLATAVPAVLLMLASFFGGGWSILALTYITIFVFAMDRLIQGAAARANSDGEFPAGDGLLVFLGISHLVMMPVVIAALVGLTNLSGWERIMTYIMFGQFFGQVSNAVAHELVHKGNRWMHRLGVSIYATLLFGHHASAHPKVHHVYVGNWRDPNTARLGESIYHYWPRAWYGSFVSGLQAENEQRARASTAKPWWTHPYWGYLLGSSIMVLLAMIIGGWMGVCALIALCLYASLQHLASDYIQHYGLVRRKLANGRLEPVSPKHSWNSPHTFSSAMMLNVQRHSDHHMTPGRPYTQLRLDHHEVPILPRSIPAMGLIALVPPLWRHMMDERVAQVTGASSAK